MATTPTNISTPLNYPTIYPFIPSVIHPPIHPLDSAVLFSTYEHRNYFFTNSLLFCSPLSFIFFLLSAFFACFCHCHDFSSSLEFSGCICFILLCKILMEKLWWKNLNNKSLYRPFSLSGCCKRCCTFPCLYIVNVVFLCGKHFEKLDKTFKESY